MVKIHIHLKLVKLKKGGNAPLLREFESTKTHA